MCKCDGDMSLVEAGLVAAVAALVLILVVVTVPRYKTKKAPQAVIESVETYEPFGFRP